MLRFSNTALEDVTLNCDFILACFQPLRRGLTVETDLSDEEEALAHDNFVSACKVEILLRTIAEADKPSDLLQ